MTYPWQVTFYLCERRCDNTQSNCSHGTGRRGRSCAGGARGCGVGDDTAFKVIPFGDELMYGYFGYSDEEVRV